MRACAEIAEKTVPVVTKPSVPNSSTRISRPATLASVEDSRRDDGRILRGRAVSTDILEASALAFVEVINRTALRRQPRLNPQAETIAVT